MLRVVFLPLFIICNYRPKNIIRALPVYIVNDYIYWTIAIIMSFSSGYLRYGFNFILKAKFLLMLLGLFNESDPHRKEQKRSEKYKFLCFMKKNSPQLVLQSVILCFMKLFSTEKFKFFCSYFWGRASE